MSEIVRVMPNDDTITRDQAERLIRELSLQLDRINDHLAGIEGQLNLISKNAPVTEFRRDHGRDRP